MVNLASVEVTEEGVIAAGVKPLISVMPERLVPVRVTETPPVGTTAGVLGGETVVISGAAAS